MHATRTGFLLFAVATAALLHSEAAAVSLATPGVMDARVITLEGRQVPLRDLIGEGRPIVIEFWATWCVPCRKTMPHLAELSRKHARDGLVVIGLTVEDPGKDMDKVKRFVSELDTPYPVAFAPRELYRLMNDKVEIGVPKILIFDRSGRLVEHIRRYSPFTNRRVTAAVAKTVRR